MRILPINYNDNNSLSFVSFGRKPRPAEFKYYVPTIREGLKVLNKELGFIIHNQSAPSGPKFNSGIGSLLKKHAENLFIPFLATHGFSSIQQEPNYIRRVSDPSPYNPLSTSKNIYMIPIEKLASEDYNFLIDSNNISPSKKELILIIFLVIRIVNTKLKNRDNNTVPIKDFIKNTLPTLKLKPNTYLSLAICIALEM